MREWWVVLNERGQPLAFAERRQVAVEALRAAGGDGRVRLLFGRSIQRQVNEHRSVAARKQGDAWELQHIKTDRYCWKCGCDLPSASDCYRLKRSPLTLCEPCYES